MRQRGKDLENISAAGAAQLFSAPGCAHGEVLSQSPPRTTRPVDKLRPSGFICALGPARHPLLIWPENRYLRKEAGKQVGRRTKKEGHISEYFFRVVARSGHIDAAIIIFRGVLIHVVKFRRVANFSSETFWKLCSQFSIELIEQGRLKAHRRAC